MKTKKLLSVLLTLCVMTAMLALAAFAADGDVAKIGDVTYPTLDAAIEAAEDGAVIELLGNAETSATLAKTVTIRSADATQREIKGLRAIAGNGVTLENVYLNLTGTLNIGGTDTTLTDCYIRAKDFGYDDMAATDTFGAGGENAYHNLTKITGKNVTLTGVTFDGTDKDGGYFPNLLLAPLSCNTLTMKGCTFNEGFAACYYGAVSGTWTVEDCKFTRIWAYCLNASEGEGTNVVVKNTALIGWNSFGSAIESVSFEDCSFAKTVEGYTSGSSTVATYTDTVFDGCTFSEDYTGTNTEAGTNTEGNENGIYVDPEAKANVVVELNGCKVVNAAGTAVETPVTALLNTDKMGAATTAVVAIDATAGADGKYTAGTFVGKSEHVEALLADTATISENEDGTITATTASYVAEVGGVKYETLEAAIKAAKPDADGVITYTILGRAEVTSTAAWIQVLPAGLSGVKTVKFVGAAEDAEISIVNPTSILADQLYDIDVSFENLILSHPDGKWVDDLGHTTNYFACALRNIGAADNTVTYTGCSFPNGACNNRYGKTVFDGCAFTNTTTGKYNLWNYGGSTEVKDSSFTGARGIKTYAEDSSAQTVAIENTSFTDISEKAAVVSSKPTTVTMTGVSVTDCLKGLLQKDLGTGVTIAANGTGISGSFDVVADKTAEEGFNITGGTFTSEISADYCAEGYAPTQNADGSYGVEKAAAYVAEVGGKQYATLNDAFAAAKDGDTVKILCDFTTDASKTTAADRATVKTSVTLDFGAYTMTVPASLEPTANFAAIWIDGGTLTVEATTGGITSGDAETCGVYAFNVKGGGKLVINGGSYFAGVTVAQAQEGAVVVNGGSFAVNDSGYPGYLLNCVDAAYKAGTATVTVNGGTFAGYDPRNNTAEGKGTNFAAPGVGVDADGDSFTAKANMAAQILDASGNSVKAYATLAEAFAAAKNGDTVKILCDFTTDASKKATADRTTVNKEVTLDLNGFTITIPAELEPTNNWAAVYITGGTLTVKDSSSDGTGAIRSGDEKTLGTYLFHLQGGNLVIESGTFFAGVTVANVQRGTATVNGGSFAVYFDAATKDARYLLNCIDASYKNGTAHIIVNGGTFAGYDPRNNAAEGKGTNFAAPGVGVDADGDSFTAKANMAAQILDASGNSVKAYATLAEALAAAKDGETVLLLADTEVSAQLTVGTAITLDLGGHTLTNTYNVGNSYSMATRAAVTLKNGTYKSSNASARGIGAYADFTMDGVTLESAGLVGLGCSKAGCTFTVKDSKIVANYAFANFANNAHIAIENCELAGTTCGIYHNGSNSGLVLAVTDTTVSTTSDKATVVLISGSAATKAAAGYQQVTLTRCTLTGATAVEVKFTDLTMEDCVATATVAPSYAFENNGGATLGFAVVSTDNTTSGTPKPEGSVIIKGDAGKYTGLVGLGSFAPVKETYPDFADETVKVYGGTFSDEVPAEYCAEGYACVKNTDGTYTVKEAVNPFGKSFSVVNKPITTVDGADYYAIVVYSGIDSLNYRKAGFAYRMEATKKDGSTVSASDVKETTVAYKAVTGTNNAGDRYTYTAEQIGAAYIYGQRFLFPVSDYTSAGTELYVTPYVVTLDGETVYGEEITLTEAALVAKDSHLFWQGQ